MHEVSSPYIWSELGKLREKNTTFSRVHHYEIGIRVKQLPTLHAEQDTDSKLVIFRLLILPICFSLVLMGEKLRQSQIY